MLACKHKSYAPENKYKMRQIKCRMNEKNTICHDSFFLFPDIKNHVARQTKHTI